MEWISSTESEIRSTCQKITRLLWNPRGPLHCSQQSADGSILGQVNQIHVPKPSLLEIQIIFNATLLYISTPREWSVLLKFYEKFRYEDRNNRDERKSFPLQVYGKTVRLTTVRGVNLYDTGERVEHVTISTAKIPTHLQLIAFH